MPIKVSAAIWPLGRELKVAKAFQEINESVAWSHCNQSKRRYTPTRSDLRIGSGSTHQQGRQGHGMLLLPRLSTRNVSLWPLRLLPRPWGSFPAGAVNEGDGKRIIKCNSGVLYSSTHLNWLSTLILILNPTFPTVKHSKPPSSQHPTSYQASKTERTHTQASHPSQPANTPRSQTFPQQAGTYMQYHHLALL